MNPSRDLCNRADGSSNIAVLSWTHPGIQLALSTDLGDFRDVKASGFKLRSVEPLAKARFDAALPQISMLSLSVV